jgi:hypothetical protein
MNTRVLSLLFCFALTSCNQSDYLKKDYLENPYQNPPSSGTDTGGDQGGTSSGTDGVTQGGVNGGDTGGTNGSTTGGSSTGTTDGGSTGGSTTGSTTGGTTTGTTTSGTTDGGSTGGSTTGTTTGGTTTGTTTGGSTTGSTTGGSTTGTTDGGTTGSTTGSTTGGTTGSSTTGGTSGGAVGTATSETFHQNAQVTKKLDILWVIDDSGSMADKQTNLGNYFDHFIRDFITRNVDFKMAITTTDTSSSSKKGKMVTGSDTKLTSAKARSNETQFFTDFANLVKVGTLGSGYEKGLEATEGFMAKHATDWLRTEAYLAVVILSDEEDQSAKTAAQYTDYLKSFKGEAGLVKVYSIVDKNLRNMQANITQGFQRYATASTNTAGVVGDIYEDFSNVLEDMGSSIINLLDSFALANTPVAGTLRVYVNSVETTLFSFDGASRSIKFDRGYTPPTGATIRVDYLK